MVTCRLSFSVMEKRLKFVVLVISLMVGTYVMSMSMPLVLKETVESMNSHYNERSSMKLSIKTFLVTCLMTGAAAYVSAMNVHVQDAPIRTVLTGLAQSSGLNVIVDDTVEGTVSIELTGVTATEAMECIAESQNLLYNRKGNVIIITAGRSYDNAKRAYTWKLKHADTETVKKSG